MFLSKHHHKLSEPILEMISNALFISSNDELPIGDFSSSPEIILDDDEKLLRILLHLHRLSSKLFNLKILPRLLSSASVRSQLIGMRVVNRLEGVEITSIVSKHLSNLLASCSERVGVGVFGYCKRAMSIDPYTRGTALSRESVEIETLEKRRRLSELSWKSAKSSESVAVETICLFTECVKFVPRTYGSKRSSKSRRFETSISSLGDRFKSTTSFGTSLATPRSRKRDETQRMYPSPELLLHPSYSLAQATSASLQYISDEEPGLLFSVMEIIEGLLPRPEHAVSVQTLLRFLTVVLCPKRTPTKVLHAADALSVALLAIPIRDVILESLNLSRQIRGVLWKHRDDLFRFAQKNVSFRDQRVALMRLCHRYADNNTETTLDRVNSVRKTIRKWMSQLPITLSNLTTVQEEDLQWDNTGWTNTAAQASFSSFIVVLQSIVSVDPTPQVVHREGDDDDLPSSPLQVSNTYRPRKGHIDATMIKSYCECILHLATASSKTSSTSWFSSTQPSPRLLKSKSYLAKYRLSIQDAVSCTHPVAVHKTLTILTTWVFTTQLPLHDEKRLVCLSEVFTLVRILLTTQHVKKAIRKSAWLNVAVLEFIKRGANHLDISLNNFKSLFSSKDTASKEDAETKLLLQHLVEDFCAILKVGTFDSTKWTLATRHAVWYVVYPRVYILVCFVVFEHDLSLSLSRSLDLYLSLPLDLSLSLPLSLSLTQQQFQHEMYSVRN